jgi:hypothetical protein
LLIAHSSLTIYATVKSLSNVAVRGGGGLAAVAHVLGGYFYAVGSGWEGGDDDEQVAVLVLHDVRRVNLYSGGVRFAYEVESASQNFTRMPVETGMKKIKHCATALQPKAAKTCKRADAGAFAGQARYGLTLSVIG